MRDELTGLLDARAFRLVVEHELLAAIRLQRTHTLLLIDVEGLHSAESFAGVGEKELYQRVGEILKRTAREADVIARLDKDDFAIFALDCEGRALGRRVAAALRRSAHAAGAPSTGELAAGIRIGISEMTPGETYDDVFIRAERSFFRRARGR